MISKSFSEHRQYFCNSSMNKQICLTSSLLGGLQFCAPVPSELLAEDFPILLPQCIQLLTLFMVVFISWTLFPVFLVLLSLVQMSTLKILVTYSLILRVYKPLCKDNDAKRSSFIHYPSLWLGLHSISLQQILQHHCFFFKWCPLLNALTVLLLDFQYVSVNSVTSSLVYFNISSASSFYTPGTWNFCTNTTCLFALDFAFFLPVSLRICFLAFSDDTHHFLWQRK